MRHFLEMDQHRYAKFGGQSIHAPKLRTRRGDMRFQFTETDRAAFHCLG